MTALDAEVIVVGGGAMGSAAARELARRGADVALLERFGPGHVNGASHGASRNFNLSYADPTYIAMLTEALPAWRDLEGETGLALLDLVGIVNHGANPRFDDIHAALTAAGIAAEFVPVGEADRRWPGIRFDSRVLFTPEAGRLHADRAVAALQASAAAHGAWVRHHTRVARLEVRGDDLVELALDDGSTLRARRVVVTVGAWTSSLLGSRIAVPLVVTQEQPAHFGVRDGSVVWPGFNHAPSQSADYDYWRSAVYGMYTPGQGVKAGWHGVGPVTDPDARSFLPEPLQLAALQRYAREWLPGVDADDLVPISCTYTTSPDSNFVLDRVGPVVVGAGFSGHGFKFTPSVGRILADLALDAGPAPTLFALTADRAR